jgi:hypothetical protein
MNHCPAIDRPFAPTPPGGRNQGGNLRPLFLRHIARIAQMVPVRAASILQPPPMRLLLLRSLNHLRPFSFNNFSDGL